MRSADARREGRPVSAGRLHGACWWLHRVPHLEALLGAPVAYLPAAAWREVEAVVGWGAKASGRQARQIARRRGVPCLLLEDGFLRSPGLGHEGPALSLVIDDLGIYYDATAPSRLEALVAAGHDDAQRARAAALAAQWRLGRISKYNHAREAAPPVAGPYVLAVDQTFGDASIRCGLADAGSFRRMLEAALDEHPGLPVVLKVHPDVIAGRKRGHFEALSPGQAARVTLLAADAHPPGLIEPAAAVYTVTSQMGFESLLWGKPVRCFGMGFYAGWGLTADELPAPRRRQAAGAVRLDDLVHAALVAYPRYVDPETGERCEPERLAGWMGLQRRMRTRFAPEVHALAFSQWKKPIVRAYFGGSAVHFVDQPAQVPAGATVAVWGQREAPAAAQTVVRLEDGFLRSVGLGAELVRPLSWVMDRRGLYYASGTPSDLEHLLATADFDDALVARARALRERIVAQRLTKYNVGQGAWTRPAGHRRVVLVPGQVESDASIAHGSPRLRSNVALLQAVRAAAPDAHVVYKPHPDVVNGLRAWGEGEREAGGLCDEVVTGVPIETLYAQVDEIHTLTSLAGFEALLRGLRVATYGQPFYAGWGLTADREPPARRQRRLTLDQLVAATLVLYPVYVGRRSGYFTTPEAALDELEAWRREGPAGRSHRERAWRAGKRAVLQLATRLGWRR